MMEREVTARSPAGRRPRSAAFGGWAALLAAIACAAATAACGQGAAAAAKGRAEVLIAVGDIADCAAGRAEAEETARLVEGLGGTIAALGDEAYPSGSERDFARCYDPIWGRLKDRTRPVPGNHEYRTPGGAAYFRYFGARAGEPGKGWYSYELGGWHVVALNSSIDVGPRSPQAAWLAEDLAAHRDRCILAYWHTPRFSSGPHGPRTQMAAFWRLLYDAGADVVVAGHDHEYERFAPMDPEGRRDWTRGIRQFVVGTGGAGLYWPVRSAPNSEVFDNHTHGVLQLSLRPGGYAWKFIPVRPGEFTDAGSGTCHNAVGQAAR